MFIFAKLKNKTNMKRNIVIIGIILIGVIVLASCKTQQKCAAYGHYSYYEVEQTETQKI